MKVNLLSIGQRLPDWVNAGFEEYQRRMPSQCQLNLIELPLPKRTKSADIARLKQQEMDSILKAIPPNNQVVALEVLGKPLTTQQLSQRLQEYYDNNQDISILIGGPDGLAHELSSRANWQWSLSPLTLPHPLVRIVVSEQLYRAWTLMIGHPYHR